MKKTSERGVTLVALVTTVIMILIISSIGITAGNGAISMTKFTQFKEELKILQTKVNELNQSNEINIGKELTNTQKHILEINSISDIIYKDKTQEEKDKIKQEFRYCDKDYIKNELKLDNIKREYLINVRYRYVIYTEGFEYENITYYMIDQINNEIYNVSHNDKNPKEGDFGFDIVSTKEDNMWKIQIANINYPGYISNWKVEYKDETEEEWKSSNTLSFYLTKTGNYYVRVTYEDINLGTKRFSIVEGSDEIENIE